METRVCKASQKTFEISKQDLAFYRRLDLPPPTLCPSERMRRRLSFRNERGLHRRKCDGTGRNIISLYSSDCPPKVYENDYWWSDNWNASQFGREFDFSRPFFEQFFELVWAVPKMARIQQGEITNSEYCNCVSGLKNCYLLYSSSENEDCIYGTWVNHSRNCVDNFNVDSCELCYECINCENCYHCKFSTNCKNCSDSWFLKNCIGCQSCFGSVNLRNKQYHFENQALSAEEYDEKVSALNLGSYSALQKYKRHFSKICLSFPCLCYEGVNNEDVSGNYISNSQNAQNCYDVLEVRDCRYCNNLHSAQDCYDVSHYGVTGQNELLYECEGVGHGVSRVIGSKLIWGGCSDVFYSYECFSSSNLFACSGLKKASYCVLNKSYSRKEYEQLVKRLKSHMLETGEFGEFFPLRYSPFAYHETVAHELFALTRSEAISKGLRWRDETPPTNALNSTQYLPDDIGALTYDVTTKALLCPESLTAYKITAQELEFYQAQGLPAPRRDPTLRHMVRVSARNPRQLWERKCAKCGGAIKTAYAPERPEEVFCVSCFLEAVN